MKFEAVPIERAAGHVLGHNIAGDAGRRVLRKGKALSEDDVATLAALGRRTVWVARLEAGDVEENRAARRIAAAASGDGLRASQARSGRVNLFATALGVLRVDLERLAALNAIEGVTLATLARHSVVRAGKMAATLKVLPYALPAETVARAAAIAAGPPALVAVSPLPARRVALVLFGSASAEGRVVRSFRDALTPRLEALAATLAAIEFVALDDDTAGARLAAAIGRRLDAGAELLMLAGETAIMDRADVAPRAIERAGGRVACFGAPVDPGNLLLLAYRDAVPIVGAPGCARSAKTNVVDLILPRLLAGDRLDAVDIARLGHGGLLDDVPERPLPRSWVT